MLASFDMPAAFIGPPQPAHVDQGMAARKVVVLVADDETQSQMRRWCEANGFDLAASFGGEPRPASEFEFHLTLFATVGPSTLADQDLEIEYAYAVPEGFEALGPDKDTPTLRVADPDDDLQLLRSEWLAAAEADPTYAEFKPHVSLSYAWSGTPALDALPLPPFVLAFDRLEVRTLQEQKALAEPQARTRATAKAATPAAAVASFERFLDLWRSIPPELMLPGDADRLLERLYEFVDEYIEASAADRVDVDRAELDRVLADVAGELAAIAG